MNQAETALVILQELIRKSGVQEWTNSETRQNLIVAANEMAAGIAEANGMALPDGFFQVAANCISFAHHSPGDFGPTAANLLEHGTPTDVALQLASVANNAARQSAKVDLGESWYEAYLFSAAFELAATPTAGNVIELWWAPSPSGTAGTANPGGVSGSDAAYAGYSSNLAASVLQLQFIGDFVCTAQATGTVQVQTSIGILFPTHRYGSLVVYNKSGAAFHSDDVESHVVASPLARQIQD